MGMGLNIEVVETIYTCPYCGVTFGSQEELDNHIRTVHIAGPVDWFKANWKLLTVTGSILAVGIGAVVVASKKKY
ncbi:hypothetical protein ES703_16078 [subsurface metagenome]